MINRLEKVGKKLVKPEGRVKGQRKKNEQRLSDLWGNITV